MSSAQDRPRPRIGWPRAVLTATVVVAIGTFGVAYVPNLIIEHPGGLHGTALSVVAATASTGTVVLLAVILRLLQRRRMI